MYCPVENLFSQTMYGTQREREREKGFLTFAKEIPECNTLRDFKLLENHKIILMANKEALILWTGPFFLIKTSPY